MNRALSALSVAAAVFAHAADAAERSDAGLRSDIVVRALTLIDTPYRYGGSSPALGFDCSGLVHYVFQSVGGPQLPRRTEDIGKVGEPITRSQLEPGDLVFFNTLSRAYSHVAIYIGDGRFLHAPARGGRVRIEALDDRYWRARFDGARRLIDVDARALQADVPGFFVARSSPRFPSDESFEVIKP
ncbi:MAG TPA: C40 family peptidase [Burkholderiaceae bacterium]|nr:C40 family peptidase [Burkholderiaceae bacterium]